MKQTSVLVVMFLAMTVLLVMVVFSVENQPHAFKDCSSCHVLSNPSGASARQMTGPVTPLCSKCHAKTLSEGYMHPVDVRPEHVMIPSDMPLSLDPSGELMCGTCHDVHSDYSTPYGTPTQFLRRQERGKAFCKICHGNVDALSKGHTSSLGEAHFRSQYIASDSGQELDPMSQNCVSCHDGTYASSVSIKSGTWTHGESFMDNDNGSHPVGIDYESARFNRGRKTDLLPTSMVDSRIRFFNGKVGCGSCHDPYSSLSKQLVMSDEKSKLCFSCHIA
jgi:predicted CXXCH cytochrome family protein